MAEAQNRYKTIFFCFGLNFSISLSKVVGFKIIIGQYIVQCSFQKKIMLNFLSLKSWWIFDIRVKEHPTDAGCFHYNRLLFFLSFLFPVVLVKKKFIVFFVVIYHYILWFHIHVQNLFPSGLQDISVWHDNGYQIVSNVLSRKPFASSVKFSPY